MDAFGPVEASREALLEESLDEQQRVEVSKLRRDRWIAVAFGVLGVLLLFVSFWQPASDWRFDRMYLVLGGDFDRTDRVEAGLQLVLIIVGGLSLITAALLAPVSKSRRRQRVAERKALLAAGQAADELSESTDVSGLIRANAKQMEAYDVLARGQAASSFRNSQVAIAVGLVVLIAGAVTAISAEDTTSKITTATLTAIGGMLSGYIGRTFLRTYERALRQLNFYFEQPLVNSYLLTAQRLIETMARGRQDEQTAVLIRRVLDLVHRLPTGSTPDAAEMRPPPPPAQQTPAADGVSAGAGP